MPRLCRICLNSCKKLPKKSKNHKMRKIHKNTTVQSPIYHCEVCDGPCQGAAIQSSIYYCEMCKGLS